MHGYAYYATDNGTTNIPETAFKVKLGDGDALPTPVPFGGVSFKTNETQIVSQIIDPAGGYVYFNDDNTYPGRVYQFTLNGTNPPVEMGYLQLQSGPQTSPPNGITADNTTTNNDVSCLTAKFFCVRRSLIPCAASPTSARTVDPIKS